MAVWLLIGAGLALLIAGGEALVRGAVGLARRLGVSPLVIGLVLVGFGTSTPELVTSVGASLAGSPGLAVGNVVGSNTANILLILGVAALIHPLTSNPAALRRDGVVMALTALVGLAVVLWGSLGRLAGAGLVALLAAYTVGTYWHERRGADPAALRHAATGDGVRTAPYQAVLAGLLAVCGLAATLAGASLLVTGAGGLARAAGVPETVIGLTIVAVGTSLPELVAASTAALRGQSDVAMGTILGSNIYNILGILGVTALVRPIAVPPAIAGLDIWVMLAATALLLIFAVTGTRVSRWEGGAFLAGYAGYLGYLVAGL